MNNYCYSGEYLDRWTTIEIFEGGGYDVLDRQIWCRRRQINVLPIERAQTPAFGLCPLHDVGIALEVEVVHCQKAEFSCFCFLLNEKNKKELGAQ